MSSKNTHIYGFLILPLLNFLTIFPKIILTLEEILIEIQTSQ